MAGPGGSFVSTGACNLGVTGSSPGRIFVIVLVLQTVQRHGVYSADYDTMHYKEPLKSFEIRVGHSPGLVLHSVVKLPQCAERDVRQYSLALDVQLMLVQWWANVADSGPTLYQHWINV